MKSFLRNRLLKVIVSIVVPSISVAQSNLNHDANRDGCISPDDAIVVREYLDQSGAGGTAGHEQFDVNQDGQITPLDALVIISCLNDRSTCSAMQCQQSAQRSLNPTIPEDQFNSNSCVNDCDLTTLECDIADCAGVCKGSAEDLGCGCGNPAAGECGCDLTIIKDCAGNCGGHAVDRGCGCGEGTACLEPSPSSSPKPSPSPSARPSESPAPSRVPPLSPAAPRSNCAYTVSYEENRSLTDVASGAGANLGCVKDWLGRIIDTSSSYSQSDWVNGYYTNGQMNSADHHYVKSFLTELTEIYKTDPFTFSTYLYDWRTNSTVEVNLNVPTFINQHFMGNAQAKEKCEKVGGILRGLYGDSGSGNNCSWLLNSKSIKTFLSNMDDAIYSEFFTTFTSCWSNKPGEGELKDKNGQTLVNMSTGQCDAVMDENCNIIRRTPDVEICGELRINYYPSPISLLWDGSERLDENLEFVQFPIDPTKQDKWYLWKASAQAPLLVYTPTSQTRVASGAQLFGNWTFFDRKRTASLAETSAEILQSNGRMWENGFQPLQTLDSDNNGAISGQELSELSLWFDSNRNGVVDIGELQTAQSAGLTSLYYQTDYVDSATGDIYAVKGFERIVDGKIIKGTSVDWFSRAADTKTELLGNQLLTETFTSGVSNTFDFKNSPAEKASRDYGALKNTTSPLSKIWKWNLESTTGDFAGQGGFLVLSEKDGIISGGSILEARLTPNKDNYRSLIKAFPIKGTAEKLDNGDYTFEFIVGSKDSAATTATVGHYYAESGQIKATSTRKMPLDNSSEAKQTMSYTWTAE